MKATIGNRLLRQIEPQEKPFEVHDQRMKGFLLRVQPSGTMTYLAQYRRGKRITLGRAGVMTPQQARDEAKMILGGVMRGIDPVAANRDHKFHTLGTFLEEEYGPWAAVHLKTADATLARIKRSFPKFLRNKLAEIEPRAAERWRTKRLEDGRKPSTVNRDLVCLKAALSKAVEWGFVDAHPLAKVKKARVDDNPIPRFLSLEEGKNLYTALDHREERIRLDRTNANGWRAARGVPLLPDLMKVQYADHLKPMVGGARVLLIQLLFMDARGYDREICLDHQIIQILYEGPPRLRHAKDPELMLLLPNVVTMDVDNIMPEIAILELL